MRVTCSICMDCFDRTSTDNVNSTACGHVFHELCLLQWHEMSKTCPTCRKPLQQRQIFKLFFSASESRDEDVSSLQNQLDDAKAKLRAAGVEKIKQQEAADALKAFLIQREDEVQEIKEKYMTAIGDRNLLESKLRSMKKEVAEKRQLSDENIVLRARLEECEKELQSTKDSRSNMANEVTCLIKEAGHWTARAKRQAVQLKALEAEVGETKKLLQDAEKRIRILKEKRHHDHMLLDHSLQESPAPERLKRPRLTDPETTLSPEVPSPSVKMDHFVCINTLMTEEDGQRELRTFFERFSPHITDMTVQQLGDFFASYTLHRSQRALGSGGFAEAASAAARDPLSLSRLVEPNLFLGSDCLVKIKREPHDLRSDALLHAGEDAGPWPSDGRRTSYQPEEYGSEDTL
ncbi:E3 ubiquitin-protein ligase TRAIP-like [Ixodes scapularis]|uniref:E3 ubiquitin-protein ligase TRAIP-like n=1 Tax=Ixodes scapularis TaxID=6945 RepID=UPI001A9E808B|nr:E3 ubiquitin-protein ligase TRAIP-like [Ixodes scapularis]